MGQTLRNLARRDLKKNNIFNHRFVVELCETMHVHYRNVRIVLSQRDWSSVAQGCSDSLKRWAKMDMPTVGKKHIELCRKPVAEEIGNEEMALNLNKNLYIKYKDKVFAEGNRLNEEVYIHFKYRDIRIELPIQEFRDMADMFTEAKKTFERVYEADEITKDSSIGSLL